MSNQGKRQESVRAITGTALSYEGDWHALFTSAGIADGPFNGRLLAYINSVLGASYAELNGAMQAFAVAKSTTGALSWNELGAFTISPPPPPSGMTGQPIGLLLALTYAS